MWKTIDDATKKEKSLVRITDNGGVLAARSRSCSTRRQAGRGVRQVHRRAQGQADRRPDHHQRREEERQRSDIWDGGHILDPNDGKTYKVRLTPIDGGKKLEVRGYIGMPMLGRTQTWIRVE